MTLHRTLLLATLLTGCPPPEVRGEDPAAQPTTSQVHTAGTAKSAPSQAPIAPDVDGTPPPGVARTDTRLGQLARVRTTIDEPPAPSQDEIQQGDFVIFAGTITCEACVETIVLRVVVVDVPDEVPKPGEPVEPTAPTTRAPLAAVPLSPGAYTVAVPRTDQPVAIEALVDSNADGKPTKGERFALRIDPSTPLLATKDHTGLDLDVTDRPMGRRDRVNPGQPTPSGTQPPPVPSTPQEQR